MQSSNAANAQQSWSRMTVKFGTLLLLWSLFAFALHATAGEVEMRLAASAHGPGNLHISLYRAGEENAAKPVRSFFVEPSIGTAKLVLVGLPEGNYTISASYDIPLLGNVKANLFSSAAAPNVFFGTPEYFPEAGIAPAQFNLSGDHTIVAISMGALRMGSKVASLR
ncbi:MAG: hypothetical protein MO847_11865 [Candidatus Protistobacter heckmanni]|nr:hypothetical protein [Candidatus Protistobacter heckmanni]